MRAAAIAIQILPLVPIGAGAAALLVFMPCYAARGIYRYVRRGVTTKDWSYP